ncbi:MAG: citrate lyase subunit alpha, partial [Spirochaetales bacterium]|nr:citrate lyase subunit alpha [Spirochaetales bacterium]
YQSIKAKLVDVLVKVDSIGESEQVGGGSLRVSQNPTERLIAERTLAVMQAAGTLKPGFNYQAGSGGISLLVTNLLEQYMKQHALQGGFASGGITGTLVRMAKEGLFHTLWDVQSFDGEAALSVAENSFHKEMSASLYANPNNPACIAHQLDVMVLSATEVDLDFNVNSVSGTDGRILGALGGGPDTAYGAKLTIVVLPSFRGRIPMINKEVNLICTPGSDVDVVVTERGIAVNPNREDLLKALKQANLKPIAIEELMMRIHALTGEPVLPGKEGSVVAVVEDRYGKKLSPLYSSLDSQD